MYLIFNQFVPTSMFNNKTSKKNPPINHVVSTLAKETFIEGNLICEGTLVIEGDFFGTIEGCEKLVIGKHGTVTGTVEVNNATIFGGVEGDVHVKELLHIHSTGKIYGDISTKKICIDVGGEFSGNCQMGTLASKETPLTPEKSTGKKKKIAKTGNLYMKSKAS